MIGSVSMTCSGILTPSQIHAVQDDLGATISGAWDFYAIAADAVAMLQIAHFRDLDRYTCTAKYRVIVLPMQTVEPVLGGCQSSSCCTIARRWTF